jgi:hypothetical protein
MATGTASRRSRRWPQWQTPRSAGGQQTCVARDAGRAVAAAAGGKQLPPPAPSPQVCSRLVFLGPVDHLGQLGQLGRRGQLASRRTGVDPHRREIGCALVRCWGVNVSSSQRASARPIRARSSTVCVSRTRRRWRDWKTHDWILHWPRCACCASCACEATHDYRVWRQWPTQDPAS